MSEAALDPAEAIVRDPLCVLRLERGTRVARVSVGGGHAVLDVPRPDGTTQRSTIPAIFVPDALARLNDVSPRARIEPAVTARLSPGDLATAIATRSAARTALEPEVADVLERSLQTLREHWRIEARWRPAAGSPGVRVVEVVDTDLGLWSVVPDGDAVELWPTTPTRVFGELSVLLPRDEELEVAP